MLYGFKHEKFEMVRKRGGSTSLEMLGSCESSWLSVPWLRAYV